MWKPTNQMFRAGLILTICLGLLLGARSTLAALFLTVAFLVVLLLVDGIRLCSAEVKRGEIFNCIMTATSYVAAVIVLAVGLNSIARTSPPSTTTYRSSKLIGLSMLLLLLVFFAGLIREGSFSIKKNIAQKRYLAASMNVAIMIVGAALLLVGGRQVARTFLR